ncbi:hypothetical protein HYDPIDRAFT_29558 [Hydnomerulius pinastri MD-312]|uniref:Mid2 domain-containing protein n=1 Tax=Hydnomerulius pinastri MD-312 TaxID=994086 RepID=A0A0C9VY96_9AGAM|nr:hypothetical protein HYDPIDRAFT_29558 [Hydnomerulius pinastri MD-312]
MYVFSAGFTGMTASFSVDNAPPISKTVAAPPGPDFQVSNVSMYDQQNIPSGNHTMVMTVLDWNGSATSMKFDYAYVNETFVATPSTSTSSSMTQTSSTSQTASGSPTTTSSKSNKIDLGGVIGGTLAGIAFLVAVVVGILYLRRRKQASPPVREDAYQATPFMSEHSTSPPPPATYGNIFGPNLGAGATIQPLARTAILRDALAAGSQQSSSDPSSRSIMSGTSSNVLQPLRRQPSLGFSTGDRASGLYPDTSSPFTDSAGELRYNFTAEQLEVIDRLRADGVPQETIARVAENFIGKHGNQSSADMSGGGLMRGASIFSAAPPPSYQTNR